MAASFALILLSLPLAAFQSANLDNLYQSNQWFDFRDAVLQTRAPAFYRGELAMAFHDWAQAEKELSAAMKATGNPAQYLEAAMGLQEIYSLTGRYKDA